MDKILGIEVSEVIGVAAGVLTSASMLPQVVKMVKEKNASQVSVLMIIVLISGVSLWIWYGIILKVNPIIYTNAFSLLVNFFMAGFKFKYRDYKNT